MEADATRIVAEAATPAKQVREINDAQREYVYLHASRRRQTRHRNLGQYSVIVWQVVRNSLAVQPLGACIDCSREGEAFLVSMLR